MSYKIHSTRKIAKGRFNLEDQVLHCNFKGEPWAVPYIQYYRASSSECISEYIKDLRPIFLIFRAMGILPLRFHDNGKVEFRLMSLETIYCLLVQSIILTMTCLVIMERMQKVQDPSIKFAGLVLEVGCMLCFSFVFLVPINHLPEIVKKARFLSNWNRFQNRFPKITGSPLVLNLHARTRRRLAFSFFVAGLFTSILFGIQIGYKWWQGIPFFYSSLISYIMTDYWVLTTDAFIITAEQMETSLAKHVTHKDRRLEDYMELWRCLSKLTQDLGNSMGYTYGGQLILYFVLQLDGIFGFISQMKMGRILITIGFLVTACIFTWLTYVLCNASHNVTNRVGPQFQEKLRSIVHNVPMHPEAKVEMKLFEDTVFSYHPVISLCGFVQLNRGLQASMISSIVTYVVVLTQFQQSSEIEGE